MSYILCQLTAEMACGVKSLTLADSEVRTVRMPQVRTCPVAQN